LKVFKWFKQKCRPLIVTTAHIGMPEMLANFASLLGFPGVAVAEVPSNEWYREFLKRREKFGMKIIPMGSSYQILLSAIKEGQFVYLVSDRDIKKKGIILDFGRGKKYFPTGFAYLSVETKTPLAFGCGVPTGPKGKYRGYILGPHYPRDINDALEWFAQNLYEFVYKYTDMWFVFQDEWV
jgi:lauroyl/myristoyl acyltransferase